MQDKYYDSLISELRDEGIPPYCPNNVLISYINQGNAALERYVENIDYEKDYTARDLLKSFVWYSFNKVSNEFFVNYGDTLLSWQFSKVGDVND